MYIIYYSCYSIKVLYVFQISPARSHKIIKSISVYISNSIY